MTLSYLYVYVDGVKIFSRRAGNPSKTAVLMLHWFPTASHMFRDLIQLLDSDFHLVAPDMRGFGQSNMSSRETFLDTFDQLPTTMGRFADVIGLRRFAL